MKGRSPLKGAVAISIKLFFNIKKGFYHVGKPDADNCCKMIQDALNGIVYVDDAQIAFGTFIKLCDKQEHISVDVWPLEVVA